MVESKEYSTNLALNSHNTVRLRTDGLKRDIDIRAGRPDIPTLQSEAVFQSAHFLLYIDCVVCMQLGYTTLSYRGTIESDTHAHASVAFVA